MPETLLVVRKITLRNCDRTAQQDNVVKTHDAKFDFVVDADEPLGVYINLNVNDISSISETKMVSFLLLSQVWSIYW
jgi:hypothetical protein